MLIPVYTTKFSKDVKKAEKQGKDLKKLKDIVLQLVKQKPLEKEHRDHSLSGNYNHHRECHIEPDWLLIYQIKADQIIFSRLGTHSELFQK